MLTFDRLRRWARDAFARAAHWWQFASIKLAVVAGIIATLQAAYPDEYAQLVDLLPEPVRPFVGGIVMAAAIWARVHPQPGIKPKGDG